MSKIYEIIVFTASHSYYADVVLDFIDPNKEFFAHRLYRQSCIDTPSGIMVKDLRIINREIQNMILVDNQTYSYAFQVSF